MDKLFSAILTMLSWTSTEAPIRAASLIGRLSRSIRFEASLGAEMGRSISYLRALASLFSESNQDVASCSMRCCWELLRGSSQGSVSLFLSLLLDESNSQLLKMLVNDCARLLNASNAYLSIQSTLILNQILAVRDAPALLAGLLLLKPISEACCHVIASGEARSSFHQLPVQLQVGCLRLVLRASAHADCLASIRRSDMLNDLMLQLQQASLASNKQVSSFAAKLNNLLENGVLPETTASNSSVAPCQVEAPSASNVAGSGQSPREAAAPSSVESIFAHGKALRSTMIKESPSVYLNAAATQSLADEFRLTSGLLVEEQGKVEQLSSKVLLLELELQQKELQNRSLLDESRAVSETLSNADAAIRQLQHDIELRDSQLLAAANTNQLVVDKDIEIGSVKAELEIQQYRSEAFSAEIARLRHERIDLIKSAGDMEQVKMELSTSLALNASLQKQIHEREQLLVTLQQQLSDGAAKDLALASANASIATLEKSFRQTLSELEKVTSANQKLQEDLHARDQLLILAHSQATTAIETIAAVESAAGHSQSHEFSKLMASANQENAFLRTRVSELEERLVQLSHESAGKLDNAVMLAANQKSLLEQQIVALENRIKEQSQKVLKLSEVHAVDLSQHESESKLSSPAASVAANHDVILTTTKLAADSHAQERAALVESASEELMAKLRAADAIISSSSEREILLLAQKSELDAEILNLRSQISEKNHREVIFNAEKSAVESRVQEMVKLSDSASELMAKLRAADAIISSSSEREILLLAQKSELDAEILNLRLQISALKASSHPVESAWSDYQEKSALESALEEESKALRSQLESQLVDFQGIMDAKDHIIEQLTEQVKKLQQQVEDAQAVNQVNSNTITSQSSIIGDLQSKIDQFSAKQLNAPPAVSSPSLSLRSLSQNEFLLLVSHHVQQSASAGKPLEFLMELEAVEQENSSLKVVVLRLRSSNQTFIFYSIFDIESRLTSQTRLPPSIVFLKKLHFYAVEWLIWSVR
jgi:hypothetical protein